VRPIDGMDEVETISGVQLAVESSNFRRTLRLAISQKSLVGAVRVNLFYGSFTRPETVRFGSQPFAFATSNIARK